MPERPYADHAHVSPLAPRRWLLDTEHPLRYVLAPGYFDPIHGIRPHDRIDVIAFGDEPPSHSLLVVDDVRRGEIDRVIVTPLVTYERKLGFELKKEFYSNQYWGAVN